MNSEKISRSGGISVETGNIFPIIKKWLYSEKDIFLREIVSNATDAVTKMKRLRSLGHTDIEDDYKIIVRLDKNAKTLAVSDNGIGMSEDELSRYICQIALSGALEFIEKYEGESNAENGIIGHFGLGFYSSFMVSDKVEVITKSYTDAPAIRWVCEDDGNYEIFDSDKSSRGTEVIMHIADAENEYLDSSKIREMLDKYCAFMPCPIYFEDGSEKESDEPTQINTIFPLWQKRPSECTDEEYKAFYHKLFNDFNDPLFYIHINADYPLNFKGILYFPKLRSEYDSLEGQVKLYYNQVFVADNVKEIIPEYLVMLRGVIDCPDLPLNVSRSYLQTNSYVNKVSSHIVKKIADKINGLCNTSREEYDKIWNDIRSFVEYAAIRDRKFFDRVKDSILLNLTDKSCVTISEYTADKDNVNIYYTSDEAQQSQYISLYQAHDIKVAVLDQFIDTQFISIAEGIYNVKFMRVDSDVSAITKSIENSENKNVVDIFRDAVGNKKLEVKFESFIDSDAPALLNISEEKRRMDDFMRAYSFMTKSDLPEEMAEQTLILNIDSPIYSRLETLIASDKEKAKFIAKYIYQLSLMSQRRLNADELNDFLSNSYNMLNNY